MPTIPNYPQGRLSAPIVDPALRETDHPQHTDYPLVHVLRTIREEGDSDLSAVEAYDPDFSVKLSSAATPDDATALLDHWLDRRLQVLKATQARLREAWQSAQDGQRSP